MPGPYPLLLTFAYFPASPSEGFGTPVPVDDVDVAEAVREPDVVRELGGGMPVPVPSLIDQHRHSFLDDISNSVLPSFDTAEEQINTHLVLLSLLLPLPSHHPFPATQAPSLYSPDPHPSFSAPPPDGQPQLLVQPQPLQPLQLLSGRLPQLESRQSPMAVSDSIDDSAHIREQGEWTYVFCACPFGIEYHSLAVFSLTQ